MKELGTEMGIQSKLDQRFKTEEAKYSINKKSSLNRKGYEQC